MNFFKILSLILFLLQPTSYAAGLIGTGNYFVGDECSIYDRDGNILKNFNGDLCIFFNDGSFLRKIDDSKIQYNNSNSQSVWSLNGFFHHSAVMNGKQDLILLIGSEEYKNARIDNLLVVDKKGKIKHVFHLQKFIKKLLLKEKTLSWNLETLSNFNKEYSHLNSFYEIPENLSPLKFLQHGNFIVNDRGSEQIIFLDKKLSKIVHTYKYSQFSKSVHDAQIMKNGHLLIFNNESISKKVVNNFSTIDEIDLKNNKLIYRYQYKTPGSFVSKICGTVQSLPNGHFFFTAVLNNEGVFAIEISKEKGEVKRTKLNYDPMNCHRVKQYDLELFLQNNRSL